MTSYSEKNNKVAHMFYDEIDVDKLVENFMIIVLNSWRFHSNLFSFVQMSR